MDSTVFFSWQSDLSRKYTKKLICDATVKAIDIVKVDATLDEAPRIDHDTLGISGAPEIATTIFKKIRSCSIFLADLSFIGENTLKAPSRPVKMQPNPNVLLELGYAASIIGWDRIILVMNTAYGDASELICDLKHRRFPITFEVGPKNKDKLETVHDELANNIANAIRAALATDYESVREVIGKLDVDCLRWMSELGRVDYFRAPDRLTVGDVLGSIRLDYALPRLLSLGILRCDIAPQVGLYAYHWTYLGKQVLISLGIRDRVWKLVPDPFTFISDTRWDGDFEESIDQD